jgi:hypothetical protein
MRRRLPTAILILLLAAFVAPIPTAAQLPTATSEVVLVDPGHEPRRELRYSWALDHRERLESAVTLDIAAKEGGEPVMDMELPVSMAINARVTEVNQDGTVWVAMTYDDVVFGPLSASGGGLPEGDTAALGFDEAMAEVTPLLDETRVWRLIDDRGRVVKTNVRFPSGFPPEVQQQITQTSNSVALLPSEPVGVGARWEATGATVTQGVSLSVTTTMELVAMDGDDITLAMSMRLADDIDAALPAPNPFDELSAEGGGTYRLDLGGVFPRDADAGITMRMAGDLPDETGQVVPVEMNLDVRMTLRSTDVR